MVDYRRKIEAELEQVSQAIAKLPAGKLLNKKTMNHRLFIQTADNAVLSAVLPAGPLRPSRVFTMVSKIF
jgi:hypothetical protein